MTINDFSKERKIIMIEVLHAVAVMYADSNVIYVIWNVIFLIVWAAQNVVYSQGGLFFCCAQHESFSVIASHKWLKSNDVDGLGRSSIHPHKEKKS